MADGATLTELGVDDPSSCAQSIRAHRVIIHPDYKNDSVSFGSDVALIELMNPIACVADEVTEYIELDNGDYSLPGIGYLRQLRHPKDKAAIQGDAGGQLQA